LPNKKEKRTAERGVSTGLLFGVREGRGDRSERTDLQKKRARLQVEYIPEVGILNFRKRRTLGR